MGKKFTRKGIKYELDNNEITVVGLKKKDIVDLIIPDVVDGFPVKWIYEHAFMHEWFETVSLPEGITKIPNATFYSCPALREIEFRGVADTVEIAQCGIGYCNSLTAIKSKRPIRKVWGDISIQHCDSLKHIDNLV